MDETRWKKFSHYEQWGHIGSEIGRAKHLYAAGDKGYAQNALKRALEMLRLMVEIKAGKPRAKEMKIFRDIVEDILLETHKYQVSLDWLEQYCTEFVQAGINKGVLRDRSR